MKNQNILSSLAVAALLIWNTGCGKKEATVQDQIKDAAGETSDALKKTTEAVKETGAKVAGEVAAKAAEVAAPEGGKAQEIIESAKSLVGEGRFQEGLVKLKELTGEKLSSTQQSMVDVLKAQIQKAIATSTPAATGAAGAAGNLLKK